MLVETTTKHRSYGAVLYKEQEQVRLTCKIYAAVTCQPINKVQEE